MTLSSVTTIGDWLPCLKLGLDWMASSSKFNALRASPCDSAKIAWLDCISILNCLKTASSSMARCSTWLISSSFKGLSRYTWQRDNSALLTLNEGFSVVAPIKVISPDSTAPRSASCWALLNRWISSTNTTGGSPNKPSSFASTSRNSLTPALIAESGRKGRPTASANSIAKVVLPMPASPCKIIDGK